MQDQDGLTEYTKGIANECEELRHPPTSVYEFLASSSSSQYLLVSFLLNLVSRILCLREVARVSHLGLAVTLRATKLLRA